MRALKAKLLTSLPGEKQHTDQRIWDSYDRDPHPATAFKSNGEPGPNPDVIDKDFNLAM